MSAPYTVLIDHWGSHETIPCARFSVALTIAKLANRDHPGQVHVFGDGAEGGYGEAGEEWRDGLTPDERARVAEVLA